MHVDIEILMLLIIEFKLNGYITYRMHYSVVAQCLLRLIVRDTYLSIDGKGSICPPRQHYLPCSATSGGGKR